MSNVQPFPANAKSILVSVTASASSSAALPGQGACLRVVNLGPNEAYLAISGGTATAVVPTGIGNANATAIINGADEVLGIPSDQVYNFSLICNTGKTATVILAVSEGQ